MNAPDPLSSPHPLDPHRRTALPVTLIAAIDPVLRDALTTDLLLDGAAGRIAALRYDADTEHGGLRRLLIDGHGVIQDRPVELDHDCISCAMRLDALPVIEEITEAGEHEGLLMVLPVAADPQAVAGTLGPELRAARIASTCALVDTRTALADLLGDDMLAERALCWCEGDARSVGEALAAQIEYCDVVIALGPADSPGGELVEHLRAHDQLLLPDLHQVSVALLLHGVRHDPGAAAQRVDPRTLEAWGGPSRHGTWTLDLRSDRAFHPERFLEGIERLGAGALRGRGCFWLPTRPHSVCQWDGAGGQVSIGAIADSGRDLPRTHLVVTGIGPEDQRRVRAAFEGCLLTAREWDRGLLPWLGRSDGLAPWLGEHSAAS